LDALFTMTQQRVLSSLFLHPDRAYQLIEIIDRARAGRGTVQRLLARLTASELVDRVPVGKRHLYRANTRSPLFPELHGLLVKTVGLADPLRGVLVPFRRRIRFAIVYGSIAKGTERAGSDIDVLIVGDDIALEDLLEAFEPVERQVGRRIHPTLYTSRDYERRRREGNSFLTSVLAGDHIALIGAPDGSPET
jgi:predicted nucleotidyltransferase